MTKQQLQAELDRMSAGKYSPYNISELADKIAWLWKWRKITAEELDKLSTQAILIMQSGVYSIYK